MTSRFLTRRTEDLAKATIYLLLINHKTGKIEQILKSLQAFEQILLEEKMVMPVFQDKAREQFEIGLGECPRPSR